MKLLLTKPLVAFCLISLANLAHSALVEEFPLNEGATNSSATTVYSSVSANTGTLINGPTWQAASLPPIPGGTGACLYFSIVGGTPAYVQTTSTAVTGASARTVAMWIMAPTGNQPQDAVLCSWGANSSGQRFTLRLDPGTSGGVEYALRLEDQGSFATAKTPLNDGNWHHVAVVFPGNGGSPANCIFYVDGNNDGQSASSSSTKINTTVTVGTAKTYLVIGNAPSVAASGYGFLGAISDLRIYSTALAQSDILQLVYGAGTAPQVTQNPTNQYPVLGDTNATAVFTVSVAGSGITYIWRLNGTNLGAPNSSTLTVGPNLTDANLGSYDVVVSNDWGATNSASALLQWGTPPVDPPHQAGVSGGGATFVVSGLPSYQTYTYQWWEAGAPIPSATNATYTKTGLTPTDSTNYSVVLTLGSDTAASAPVAVTVVSTSSAYATQVLGDNPMAYWRLDESSGATVAADQSTFDNGRYVNYTGTELGASGALINDSDTASTFNLSSENNYVEVPYDPALARTNSFSLEAWVNPNAASTGVYQTIIGSHTKNATSGVELGINGTLWDFRTGSSDNSSAQIFDDLNGGTVTNGQWTHVVATYDGLVKRLYIDGMLAGTETTNVFPSTTLWRIGADDTYQSSAALFLSGSIDEPAIYWRALSQGQIVNHYDMATYGPGVAPFIITAPQNQALVLGTSNAAITFNVVSGGSPPFYYQWAFDNTNIAGATGQSLVITNAGTADLGSYTVTVSNSINSVATAPVVLSLAPIAIVPADQGALPGGAPMFVASTASGGSYTYQWFHNGTNISGATAQDLVLPSVTTNDAGTYDVLVTSGANSESSAPATLEILTPPTMTYAQVIANDGPVDWWRFDDPSGSVLANDMVGGNPGSVYPDVTLGVEGAVLGDSDTAALFTGYGLGTRAGNSRIQIYNTYQVNAPIFTVEVWAMADGGAGTPRSVLTSRDTGSGNAGYCLYAGTDDHWQFWLGNGSSTWTVIEGPPVALNQWTHLTGIYDGANGIFYVNGGLAGETPTAYIQNGNYNMNVGAGETETVNGGDFFPGRIDELAIYDAALTQAQIQTHYAAAFQSDSTPRFTVQPLTRAALAGRTYQFAVTGFSAPPSTYGWLKNGSNMPGQTNATLTLSNLSSGDTAAYQAILVHGANTGTSLPATLTVLNGEAVSVNLQGNEPTYTVAADTGYAGYVRTTNWNDVGYHPNSGTASNLVNDLGATTTVTVSWATQNNQRWGGPIRVPQGDFAMMSGFFDDNASTNNATVTISGIPENYQQAGYSLYVYMGGPAASATGTASAGAVTSSTYFAAVSVDSQTNYYHGLDLAFWAGNYLEATNTNPLDSSPTNADYAVFSGLNDSTATIVLSEDPSGNVGPSTISGFQLVANVVNQPSLSILQTGANVTLSWSGNWVLQQTADLGGQPVQWQDVTNAASPYPVTVPPQGHQFFRLRSP